MKTHPFNSKGAEIELGDSHKLGRKSQGTTLEPLKYHADSCVGKNPKESDT